MSINVNASAIRTLIGNKLTEIETRMYELHDELKKLGVEHGALVAMAMGYDEGAPKDEDFIQVDDGTEHGGNW